jgi:hypothetical protein
MEFVIFVDLRGFVIGSRESSFEVSSYFNHPPANALSMSSRARALAWKSA